MMSGSKVRTYSASRSVLTFDPCIILLLHNYIVSALVLQGLRVILSCCAARRSMDASCTPDGASRSMDTACTPDGARDSMDTACKPGGAAQGGTA